MKARTFLPQSIVVKEGDSPDHVYFIKEGSCYVVQQKTPENSHHTVARLQAWGAKDWGGSSSSTLSSTNPSQKLPKNLMDLNTRQVILAMLGPRQVFGDLECVLNVPRVSSVMAAEVLVVYEVKKQRFLKCN